MAIGGVKTPWKLARSGIRDDEKPINSSKHRDFVRGQRCVAARPLECRGPVQFCHYHGFKDGGITRKPGDERGFPACWHHHIAVQHNVGELAFQLRYGIDLKVITLDLARRSPDQRVREAVA